MSTQRASESWQTLDEVARREQEGVRLVSAVVPPKLWAVDGGRGAGWNLGCLGFISGLGWGDGVRRWLAEAGCK